MIAAAPVQTTPAKELARSLYAHLEKHQPEVLESMRQEVALDRHDADAQLVCNYTRQMSWRTLRPTRGVEWHEFARLLRQSGQSCVRLAGSSYSRRK